jgi:hypothetical protein
MTKTIFGFVAAVAFGAAATVNAATATITQQGPITNPGPEAVAAGAPAGGQVHKFVVTSDADILSVNQVLITGPALFQVAPPFGSNTEPPDPAFVGLNRALEADSWISTPGATSRLGPDMPGDGTSTWGDLTNDGAQGNFLFATLTIPPQTFGRFQGRISLAGAEGPEVFPFDFPLGIPEPGTFAMAGMGLIGFIAMRRRAA